MTTKFRVSPVMTTSISLRIFSCNAQYYNTSTKKKQEFFEKYFTETFKTFISSNIFLFVTPYFLCDLRFRHNAKLFYFVSYFFMQKKSTSS